MVDVGSDAEFESLIAKADVITAIRERTGKVWVLWIRPAEEVFARGEQAQATVTTVEVRSKAELDRLRRAVRRLKQTRVHE
jgi:hypothetical protein